MVECESHTIKTIAGSSPYHQLLQRFPEITRPNGTAQVANHATKHHIATTPGPPVAQKPQRLAPDKLRAPKKEFDLMVHIGIARPSQSPWSSLLRIVPKHGDEWRPCGDYRALNARTIADRFSVKHIQDFSQSLSRETIFLPSTSCAHLIRYRSPKKIFRKQPSRHPSAYLSLCT